LGEGTRTNPEDRFGNPPQIDDQFLDDMVLIATPITVVAALEALTLRSGTAARLPAGAAAASD
jgi:hypothetical protein